MTSPAIADLIDNIGVKSPTLHAVVIELRALVRQNAPEAGEELKYGGIFYSFKRPICGIYAFKNHVSLEFSRGAEFDDGGMLGDGAYRRHLKFSAPSDISPVRVARYIAEAYSRA